MQRVIYNQSFILTISNTKRLLKILTSFVDITFLTHHQQNFFFHMIPDVISPINTDPPDRTAEHVFSG